MTGTNRGAKSVAVRNDMLEALMLLMAQKKFQDISVTELCRKAGASRMAFYRNYDFMEDILVDHLDRTFEDYLAEMAASPSGDATDFAAAFFAYFGKKKRFLKLLIKSGMENMLLARFDRYLKRIFETLLRIPIQDASDNYFRVEFVAGGLYKILIAWIADGTRKPPDEMAALVAEFVMRQRPAPGIAGDGEAVSRGQATPGRTTETPKSPVEKSGAQSGTDFSRRP